MERQDRNLRERVGRKMGIGKKWKTIEKSRENWKRGNLKNTKWENIKIIGNMESLKNMKLAICKDSIGTICM